MPTSSSQDEEIIELSFRFRQLDITVRGPAREALPVKPVSCHIRSLAGLAPSLSPSSRSFAVVSSLGALGPSRETCDQILSSFPRCPGRLLALASRLGSGRALGKGGFGPYRSAPLELRSRFYAIVKCEGTDVPVIFRSSASCWSAIRSLEDSGSISHSFPSELEAKIYVEAAVSSGEVPVLPP